MNTTAMNLQCSNWFALVTVLASSAKCRVDDSCMKLLIAKYSRFETVIANGIKLYAVADSGKASRIKTVIEWHHILYH